MIKNLSIVLAIRNEQANLARCLKSVVDLTDDLVVVDGQSTDDSVKIAKQFTSRVYLVSHKPMFHLNKQIALEKAKHSWVLQLDADEVISDKLAKEIAKSIKSTQYSAFSIPRKNYFLTRFLTKGGQYPDRVIRLVRKNKSHFPCQSVHEQIAVQGPVGQLENDLLHYADPNFSHYIEKFNRYTSIESAKLKLNLFTFFNYLFFKPIITFFLIYLRHKGFVDGLPGFIFAIMSALHFPVILFKTIELKWSKK